MTKPEKSCSEEKCFAQICFGLNKTDRREPRYAFLTGKGYNFGGDGPGTVVVRRHVVDRRLGVLVHCVVKEEVIQVLLLVWKIMVVYQQSEKLAMKFEVH